MYSFEKNGELPRDERRIEVFRNVLKDCRLMDVGYSGNWFTLGKGNLPETIIQERLDRGMANKNWMFMFPEATIQLLVHLISDHCLLLITTKKEDNRSWKIFKFEAWWVLKESFEDKIKLI